MEPFNIGNSLKLQSYVNNQELSEDDLNFLDNTKFNDLMTREEFTDVYNKVQKYRTLEQDNIVSPSPERSAEMQELAQDVMYSTGQAIHSIKMSSLKTVDTLDDIMARANCRSKNDLFVEIDYDDYSNTSNFVKCKIVGHDRPYAYGIAANAKLVVTKSGKIITSKNALYSK